MTKINLSDLETKAKLATPGPWKWGKASAPYSSCYRMESEHGEVIFDDGSACGEYGSVPIDFNTDFIASMNPQTALALIRIARAAKEFMSEYVTMRSEILASVGAEKNLEKALEGVE